MLLRVVEEGTYSTRSVRGYEYEVVGESSEYSRPSFFALVTVWVAEVTTSYRGYY